MQDYEYDTDDEYDFRKSSISDAGFLALEALVIIHGKNLDGSPLSSVQSTQRTLRLHEWIVEKSQKYKIESNFEIFNWQLKQKTKKKLEINPIKLRWIKKQLS